MKTKGFTLIELLVTVAVLAILAAMLFPIYARASRGARKTDCINRIGQLSLACRLYLEDWEQTPILQDPSGTGYLWARWPNGRMAPPMAVQLAAYAGSRDAAQHLLRCAEPRGGRGYQQDPTKRPWTLTANDTSHPGPMVERDLMR